MQNSGLSFKRQKIKTLKMNHTKRAGIIIIMIITSLTASLFDSNQENGKTFTTGFDVLEFNTEKDQPENVLLGSHPLTLQWVGWDHPATIDFYKEMDLIICKGEQLSKENVTDFLKIDGIVEEIINEKEFLFKGTIITKVNYINEGEECTREGSFRFKSTGTRKYWRMREMDNPCDGVTDYVDIFFKKL